MSSRVKVEVTEEVLEKLIKRVVHKLYVPHKNLTPEQVERHYRHLELANRSNLDLLIEDINQLFDEMDKNEATQDG